MKLSLAWIFDHILDVRWQDVPVDKLMHKLSTSTAEIESYCKISFDLDAYALAEIKSVQANQAFLFIPEWQKEVRLPLRSDGVLDSWYLVKRQGQDITYATALDFYGEKDGLLPALFVPESDRGGLWKASCEKEDYLITIDNKSLTHRADLWGHRGFAREVAALLSVQLMPEDRLITSRLIKSYEHKGTTSDLTVSIAAPHICDRFATLTLNSVYNAPSLPFVAQRLIRVGGRPINAIVDGTNYVMYDLGQPLHAFDGVAIQGGSLVARTAKEGERIELLDGTVVELSEKDCVIADSHQPLALAGVMGGAYAAVRTASVKVVVEGAHFSPSAIRRTALEYKKRTEASSRFEKGLDPNQNVIALMRFLYLMQTWGIKVESAPDIISLGLPATTRTITVTHEYITKKIGSALLPEEVRATVSKLGFGIQEKFLSSGIEYTIVVPTFRLGDVKLREDIVEEIARLVGYSAIHATLPARMVKPGDNHRVNRIRALKNHCAFALGMHEIASYPFYDEEFLRVLDWKPNQEIELSNPVSQYSRRLIGSLVPHLIKAVTINTPHMHDVRFFEWNRIWSLEKDTPCEQQSLGLIWYNTRAALNFYELKAELSSLFDLIGAPIEWLKPTHEVPAWYSPYQTAALFFKERHIGYAGIGSSKVEEVAGCTFIAELDGSFLQEYVKPTVQVQPILKYPCTELDVSLFIPVEMTVRELEELIYAIDERIRDVQLVDYYERAEWFSQRAVTLRYKLCDAHKTLTKEEIDQVSNCVAQQLRQKGATVR